MNGRQADQAAGRGERSREPLTRADRIVVTMLAALLGGTLVGFVAIGSQLVGLQRQIGDVRTDMTREVGDLRTDMTREIGDVRTDMTREIGDLRKDMTREIGDLRKDMTREIGDLRKEMHSEFGKLSDRITRIETMLETPLVPAPVARSPAGP